MKAAGISLAMFFGVSAVLADEWDRESAQKRGGGRPILSLEQARAGIVQAESDLANARRAAGRLDSLSERQLSSISKRFRQPAARNLFGGRCFGRFMRREGQA